MYLHEAPRTCTLHTTRRLPSYVGTARTSARATAANFQVKIVNQWLRCFRWMAFSATWPAAGVSLARFPVVATEVVGVEVLPISAAVSHVVAFAAAAAAMPVVAASVVVARLSGRLVVAGTAATLTCLDAAACVEGAVLVVVVLVVAAAMEEGTVVAGRALA
jgi:hypothetical protein